MKLYKLITTQPYRDKSYKQTKVTYPNGAEQTFQHNQLGLLATLHWIAYGAICYDPL